MTKSSPRNHQNFIEIRTLVGASGLVPPLKIHLCNFKTPWGLGPKKCKELS